MAACRFLTGVFQVFISIYAPIWCDEHGPEGKKTTWITSIIVANPAGMVSGYLMTAVIISAGGKWQWSFFVQVILLTPIAIYLGCIDKALLEIDKPADKKEEDSQTDLMPSESDANEEDNNDPAKPKKKKLTRD